MLLLFQYTNLCQFSMFHLRMTSQADLLMDRTLIQSRPSRSCIYDTGKVIHCNLTLRLTHHLRMQKETETETDHMGLLITYSSLHFFPA